MLDDPITEEIRSIRRKLAAQLDNDIFRILADVRQREVSDGRTYVTLPKRPARRDTAGQTHGPESARGQLKMRDTPEHLTP
jgi:hypothetical protein